MFRRAPKAPKEPERSGTALAMVMLRPNVTFDAAAIAEHARRTWVDSPLLGTIQGEGSTAVAASAAASVALMHMEMPIPSPELQGPIALAWHWQKAAEEIAAHRSHVVCIVQSASLSPLHLRLLHTQLVGSLLATHPSFGVYVGDATLVRSAKDFLTDAMALASAMPLLSWISLCPVRGAPGRSSAYTYGLAWFGLRELEARECAVPMRDLMGRLADIAQYEIGNGLQIAHGHTVGESAQERIRVTHETSAFVPKLPVALLHWPS